MRFSLTNFARERISLVRDGYVSWVSAVYQSKWFKFYIAVSVLAFLTVFYDPQILYACFLVISGFLLGKAIGPYPMFFLALAMLPLLTTNPWTHKIQFAFTDTNYTAYIFYLLVAPIILYRAKFEKATGWLNYIFIIPALLSLSRGAILASFTLLLYTNKKYARYSLAALLVVAPIAYSFLFPERSGGSDVERLYIWQQILDGNVFYAKGQQFVNLYVYSPVREENLLHLHNTPVTWLFHVSHSVIASALYAGLLVCVRAVSFLLLIPSFFLTVAPGPFYLLFGLSLGATNPFRRS